MVVAPHCCPTVVKQYVPSRSIQTVAINIMDSPRGPNADRLTSFAVGEASVDEIA
jgi:hypothetical protein